MPSIQIVVVEARNLPVRASALPPSTFVAVSLDGVTHRTKGLAKLSAAPAYGQTLSFASGATDDLVHITVYDRRMMRSVALGVIEFTLGEGIEASQQSPVWFAFVGHKTGELRISVRLNTAADEEQAAPAAWYRDFLFSPPAVARSEVEDVRKIHFEAAVAGKPRFPAHVWPRETLRVHVLRARNLRAADATGKSDPYAVVSLNHVSCRTSVETQTLFPQWRDAVFEFGNDLNILAERDVLHVDIYDWDRFKRADFLGSARVPLWTLLGRRDEGAVPIRHWFALHSAEAVQSELCAYASLPSRGLGEVELELAYFAAPPTSALPRYIKTAPMSRRHAHALQRGKVWRFSVEVEVYEVRHLARHEGRAHLVVECAGESKESLATPLLVWHNAVFHFAGEDRRGVPRFSALGIALVSEHAGPVCLTCIDLACLCHELGFIDVEGLETTRWFTMLGAGGTASPSVIATPTTAATAAAQIKLRIALRPIAETRLQDSTKVSVVLDDARGLHALRPTAREMFAHVRVGARVLQTSVCAVDGNGQAGVHAAFAFEAAGAAASALMGVTVFDESGAVVGRLCVPLDGPLDVELDEVVSLTPDRDAPMVALLSARSTRDVWRASGQHHPSLRVRVTRLRVEEDLRPVLGVLTVSPARLHVYTHTFKHDLVLVVRFGDQPALVSKTYTRCADVAFRDEEPLRFPVHSVHDQVVFQVRDLVDVAGPRRLLADAGRLIGAGSVALFEAMLHKQLSLPLVNRSRSRALLRVGLRYREDVGALFASDANPPPRPVPAFSIENSAAEWLRFLRIAAWGGQIQAYVASVLAWERPAETMAVICLGVCFSTLDFLSSRPLLLLPLAFHAALLVTNRRRHDGSFIAMFLKRGSQSSARVNASLRIAVVGCTGLVAPPLPLPLACVGLSHPSHPELVRIGQTPRALRPTASPQWAVDGSSWKRFACFHGAQLVTWSPAHGVQTMATFLVSVVKRSEDAYLQVLVHGATLRRPDMLAQTHCCIQADNGDEARTKTKILCRWDELLVINARPGEPVLVSLVEGLMDHHTVCACTITDTSNGRRSTALRDPRGTHVGDIDLTFEWLGAVSAESKSALDEAALNVMRTDSDGGGDGADNGGSVEERNVRVAKKSLLEIQRVSIEAWTHASDAIHVDVYDGHHGGKFLGRATLPLRALVTDHSALDQPPVRRVLALQPRHDGTHNDEELLATLEAHGALGKVEIVAQISLPEAGAGPVARKRGPLSFLEQYNALRRNAEWTYRGLRAFNDRMEQLRNTVVWAVQSRTQLVARLNLAFMLVCFVLPTRLLFVLCLLFLFTEKFRPHGVLVIKAKHFIALAPTDDDMAHVVNRSAHAAHGSATTKGSNGGGDYVEDDEEDISTPRRAASTPAEADDDGDDDGDGDARAVVDVRGLWRAIKSRAAPLVRPNLVPLSAFEVPIMSGHLRVLERHVRGATWRRVWAAFGPLPCELRLWESKAQAKRPPAAHLFGITEVRKVLRDSKEHVVALEHHAHDEALLFVVLHEFGFAGSLLSRVRGHDGGTMFAAPTARLAQTWAQAVTGTRDHARGATSRLPQGAVAGSESNDGPGDNDDDDGGGGGGDDDDDDGDVEEDE